MGNVASRKIYKWSIEGYSSMERNATYKYTSGYFEAKGYRWKMVLYPNTRRDSNRKSFLILGIILDVSSLPSNVVLKADYKLGIYDELHGKHVWRKGYNAYFSTKDHCWTFDMIPMKRFKSSEHGFLVNDGCLLGAEIMKVSPVILRSGASEFSSIQEKRSYSSKWTIRNFSGTQKPIYSKDFQAGRLNWFLKLEKNDNFISLFLELEKSSTLPPNSGVHVEFTLCVMDQVKGKHKKLTGEGQFCSNFNIRGWDEFLDLEDLKNPSNGFLVNDTCIVEASIAVLGSSTYHNF